MRDSLSAVQSIVVLGANSEIAVAFLRGLDCKRLNYVCLAGRDLAGMQGTATWLRDNGAKEVAVESFDAAAIDSHPEFVERVFTGKRDIDMVLFAFGVLAAEASSALQRDAALEAISTNYLGAVSVALPITEKLRGQGHGTIVALSSVAAERPRKSNFVYGSTKAGFDAFFQGLADRLHGTGVEVLVVRPGFVHTKMTKGMKPLPLATTPEKVAADINAALRGRAITAWSPAPLRWVMLLLRMAPRAVFRRIG